MERRELIGLLVAVLAVLAASAIGGLSSLNAADEYAALEQPSWAPPAWLFGPAWTVLYALIALSGWQVWRTTGWSAETKIWTIQLAMNALWTPLFFGLGWRGIALAWILALDAVVLLYIVRTWKLGWPAWAMVPYLAWISFATALNAAVWHLNAS